MITALVTMNGPKFVQSWIQVWQGLWQIVAGVFALVVGVIGNGIGVVMAFLTGFASGASATIAAAWNGIASFTTGGVNKMATAIAAMATNISTKLAAWAKGFTAIGTNIVNSLLAGIQSAWGKLSSWLIAQAKALIADAASALQIASPSKPFVYMGKMITAGIRMGVKGFPDALNQGIVNPLSNLANVGRQNSYSNVSNDKNFYGPYINNVYPNHDNPFAKSMG
jgi:phage-related protein